MAEGNGTRPMRQPTASMDNPSSRARTSSSQVKGRTARGVAADQLLRERSYPNDVTAGPTKVHPHVAAIGPT